jgi:OmpA-OmpF porin, OOP family
VKAGWLVAIMLTTGTAWAQEPSSKFYVALDVGRSRLEASQSMFFAPDGARTHGADIAFKGLFGIQISRYFAVEAGYTDFGSFAVEGIPYSCAPNSPPPCTFNVTAGARGPSTNVVGLWPFAERWSMSFRGGAQYSQVSTTTRDPDVQGSASRYHDSSWGLVYGAGLNYQVTPRMRIRLNWEQNDQISFGLNLGGGAGVYDLNQSSLTSLGLDYRF